MTTTSSSEEENTVRFTVAKGEGDLAQLTRRLFEIKGPGAKAREKEIQASLLAANPHLADLETIPEGTPIVLPATGIEAPIKESGSIAPTVLQLVKNQLGTLSKLLEEVRAGEVADLKEAQKILKSKNFGTEARQTAEGAKQLTEIATEASNRLNQLEEVKKPQEEAMNRLQTDLETFIGRFL